MNRALVLTVVFAGCCSAACVRSALKGPPEVRLGRDECAECGMLINEDRCSSASIIESQGHFEYALFDDIGCMLDHHRGLTDASVTASYVHDYNTRAWVDASAATFVLGEGRALPTPMGSGIVAFARRADADAGVAASKGRSLTITEVSVARREYMEAKWGRPEEGK